MPPHILFKSPFLTSQQIEVYYNCEDVKDSAGASALLQHFASISS